MTKRNYRQSLYFIKTCTDSIINFSDRDVLLNKIISQPGTPTDQKILAENKKNEQP